MKNGRVIFRPSWGKEVGKSITHSGAVKNVVGAYGKAAVRNGFNKIVTKPIVKKWDDGFTEELYKKTGNHFVADIAGDATRKGLNNNSSKFRPVVGLN